MHEKELRHSPMSANENPEVAGGTDAMAAMMRSTENGFGSESMRAGKVHDLFMAATEAAAASANDADADAGDPETGRAAWEEVRERHTAAG